MEFEKVIHGIVKYMDRYMYGNMNDLQEFAARVAVGRMTQNLPALKKSLQDNAFLKTFAIFDDDGKVDIDSLLDDVKEQIRRKEKISFSIPMFGKFTFTATDVDVLRQIITEG